MGFLITSLLDKSHLHAYGSDAWGNEGSIAWRARAVLFVGVALMAGGLAGSLVRSRIHHRLERSSVLTIGQLEKTVLILKYMIPGYNEYAYYGGANVGMNGGVMLRYLSRVLSALAGSADDAWDIDSAIVLWIAQSASDEYRYELTL